MASEIRVNKINNRAGLGTITIADTGVVVNGIVTCTEISGLNALNIAGVSTFASPLDINGDIDVDGHTNLDNLSVAGVSTFSDDVTFTGTTGNIVFDKSDNSLNIKDGTGLKIGDGADLHIYHGGAGLANATFIDENGSGRLRIRTNDYVEIGKIASPEMSARFFADGACELYHDNVKRLETSAKGIQVGTGVTIETNGQATFTGIVTASAFKLSDGSNVGGVESDAQENTVGGTNAGDSFSGTSATHNTLFGYDCGTSIDTGDRNSAYGADALKLLTSGTNNSVFGAEAMDSATTAEKNVAMGYRAAYSATSCANGVFIGHECAEVLTTGSHNIIIGGGCGHDLTTGGYNTLVGYKAGSEGSSNKLTTGSNNLLLGHDSAPSSESVSNEITLGDSNISLFRVPGINLTFGNNGAVIAGVVTATSFSGDGSSLSNLPAGAPVGGASTNTVFFENDKAVAVNYQVTSTKNAMSAGPIAINAGIAVTVPSGCAWTIV